MKKILALLLAAIMVLGLVACGNDSDNASASASAETSASDTADNATDEDEDTGGSGQGGTEFSVAIASTPETIDPQLNSSSDGGTYLMHINQGLYRYKWDSTGVELGHAESVDVSDDGTVWTIKIREDSKWSDGEDLTAQDFEYTLKRLVDPDIAAPYAADMGQFLLNGVAIVDGEMGVDELGVKVIDDKTLELTLEGPCTFFEEILAFPSYMPVREDIIEAHGDRWTLSADTCVMAGPYTVEEHANDEYLRVVQNEHYYDKDALVATEITFQFLANDQVNLTSFQAGEIVFAKEFPIEEQQNMESQGVAYTLPNLGTYYVSLNNIDEVMNNKDLRKALTLAVDRDYIANTVMEGTVIPAGAIVGAGFEDEDGKEFVDTATSYFDVHDYEGNLEMAKQALADAGYPNGEGLGTLEYKTNDTTTHKLVAEALQSMWKEIGVNVEIVIQEWNVFLADRRDGNYVIARNGWLSDYNDPMSMLGLFYSSSGNNETKYDNTEYDALLDTANTSGDLEERMQVMRDAQDLLIGEDWATCPIYYYTTRYLAAVELIDWAASPVGYQFFHLAYLEV